MKLKIKAIASVFVLFMLLTDARLTAHAYSMEKALPSEISIISGMETMNAFIEASDKLKKTPGLTADYIIEDGDFSKISGKADIDFLGNTAHVFLENTVTGDKDEIYLRGRDVFGKRNGGKWSYASSPYGLTEFDVLEKIRAGNITFEDLRRAVKNARYSKDRNGNIIIETEGESADDIIMSLSSFIAVNIPEVEIFSLQKMGDSKKMDFKMIISPQRELKSISLYCTGNNTDLLLACNIRNTGKSERVMIPEETAVIKYSSQ